MRSPVMRKPVKRPAGLPLTFSIKLGASTVTPAPVSNTKWALTPGPSESETSNSPSGEVVIGTIRP